MNATATELTIGLRFKRSSLRAVDHCIAKLKDAEQTQHVGLFERVAKAIRENEPLVVVCETETEAIAMADGFTQFGIVRPTIEHLNGTV